MESSTSDSAHRSEDTETLALDSGDSSSHLEDVRPELPALRFWLLCLGLLMGLLLSFLDTSIVATSIFAIATDFDALSSVNWVVLAYSLTYLGCAVLLARISDIIGRRNAFLASYVIFIVFSIACGFAMNLGQLIAFRAVQGLGGSGLYSITMIILPEVTPRKQKKFTGGLIGMTITISGVLGPVLGGTLTKYATWPWVFWINGPIGLVSMLLFYSTWPDARYLPHHERRSWKELDYVGSILLIAAAVLVVYPFQNAGIQADQWSKAIFIAPLVIGVALWLALLAWSIFVDRCWRDSIAAAFPIRLLQDRVYASAVLNTLLLGFPYMLIIYAFPLRLQIVNDKDPLLAGVMLLPMLGSSAAGSILSGSINNKQNRIFETLLVATCLMVLGCGLLSTLSSSYELESKALGFLVFVGLGFGMTVSTTTIVAAYHASVQDHAPAQGIMAQVRVLGGSIGIAASSAVVAVMLEDRVGSSQIPSPGSGDSSLEPGQLSGIRQGYSDGFDKNMRVCTIIGCVAILSSLGTFTRKRFTLVERREEQIRERIERGKAAQSSHALTTRRTSSSHDGEA
ncbi:major facilitator superfamily transporter [Hypoxylon sp. NC1633]|nr:major facilitator superfamily transporter [Hypoxylon sp. NC1633]